MIDPLKSVEYITSQAGLHGEVVPAFVVSGLKAYIGFSLRNPQGMAAKEAFDRGFATIRKNGVLERILKKWRSSLTTPTR